MVKCVSHLSFIILFRKIFHKKHANFDNLVLINVYFVYGQYRLMCVKRIDIIFCSGNRSNQSIWLQCSLLIFTFNFILFYLLCCLLTGYLLIVCTIFAIYVICFTRFILNRLDAVHNFHWHVFFCVLVVVFVCVFCFHKFSSALVCVLNLSPILFQFYILFYFFLIDFFKI